MRAEEGEVVTEGKITTRAPQAVGVTVLYNLEQMEKEVGMLRGWCYWDTHVSEGKHGPYRICPHE